MIVTMKGGRSSLNRLANRSQSTITVILVILATVTVINAGPTNFRMKRMMREAYSDPDNSNPNSAMSQDTCMLDGSLVPRSSVSCEKKAGCRAIQRTGECCPDYQCECTRDEKVYGNGEKLTDPETPCRVCYCQGGEITCSKVTCYIRNDCEPKFITGRCCPEYDNCPPLEHVKFPTSTTPHSHSGEEMKESNQEKRHSLTEAPAVEFTTSSTTAAETNNNPLGIKIKEITKPEEIRITDDKPKDVTFTKIKSSEAKSTPMGEMKRAKEASMESSAIVSSGESTNSPSTTESIKLTSIDESSSSSTPETATTMKTTTTTTTAAAVQSDETVSLQRADANYNVDAKDGSKTVRHADNDTKPPADRNFLSDNHILNSSQHSDEEVEKAKNKVATEDSVEAMRRLPQDSTAEASEHEETGVVTDHSRPSVLQIGDKLVIVDHSLAQPIKVITVKEVAGLQRGTDEIEGAVNEEEMQPHHSTTTTEKRVDAESTTSSVIKVKSELDALSVEVKSDETTSAPTVEEDVTAAFETAYHASGDSSSEVVFETQHFTEAPPSATTKVNADIQLDNFDQVSSSAEFVQVIASSFRSTTDDESTTQGVSISGEEHSNRPEVDASGDKAFDTVLFTEGPPMDLNLNESAEIIFDTKTFDDTNSTDEGLSTHVHDNSLESFSSTSQAPHGIFDEPADITRKTYIEEDEIPNHVLIDPGYARVPEDLSYVSREGEGQGQLSLPDDEATHTEQRSNFQTVRMNDTETEIELNTTALYSMELGGSSNETNSTLEELAIPNFSVEDNERLLEFLNGTEVALDIQERSPGEPHLVPEWERLNGTDSENSTEIVSDLVSLKSPGEPNLVPEWERTETSTETGDSTSAPSLTGLELAMEQAMASIQQDTSSSREQTERPSQNERLAAKYPEPTTSRTKVADILDDAPSSAGSIECDDTLAHNPKDDAESLKYENNDESEATQFIKNLEASNGYDKFLEKLPKWRLF